MITDEDKKLILMLSGWKPRHQFHLRNYWTPPDGEKHCYHIVLAYKLATTGIYTDEDYHEALVQIVRDKKSNYKKQKSNDNR